MMWFLVPILIIWLGVAATSWYMLDITTRSRRTREIARKTERKVLAAARSQPPTPRPPTRSCSLCESPFASASSPAEVRNHAIYHEGKGQDHWTPDAHPCWGFGGNVCPYPPCPTNQSKGLSSNYTREILQRREEPKLPNLEELATQIATRRLPRPPQRLVVPYDEAMARAGLIEPEMVQVEPRRGDNWNERRWIIENNRERALNNITQGGSLVHNGEVVTDFDRQVEIITEIYWKRRNEVDGTPIPDKAEEPRWTFVWHPVDLG